MLIAGESLLILETEPAGYVAFARQRGAEGRAREADRRVAVRRVRPALPLRPRGPDRRRPRRGAARDRQPHRPRDRARLRRLTPPSLTTASPGRRPPSGRPRPGRASARARSRSRASARPSG